MSGLDITKFSSIAIKKANVANPYIGREASDGTLALGSVADADIKIIINNPDYYKEVSSSKGEDNYPIVDGTLVYNRDQQKIQLFIDGAPQNVAVGNSFTLKTAPAAIKKNTPLLFQNQGDAVNLVAASIQIEMKGGDESDQSIVFHKKRRQNLKKNGITATVNPTTISDFGYLNFANDTDANSEGFIYLDSSPVIVLQHQVGGTGTTTYNNTCVTITGGGLSASSSSANALLEINSTTGGFLPSRLTTDQINALSLSSQDKGLLLYNATTSQMNICNGTGFDPVVSSLVSGNGITITNNNNIPVISATPRQSAVFLADGTWNIPAGITSAKITLVGAGGGGGTTTPLGITGASGGGGSGALCVIFITDLIPATSVSIQIGKGGLGQPRGADTTFTYTPNGGTQLTVTAQGGASANDTARGGAGGQATVIPSNMSGFSFPGMTGNTAYSIAAGTANTYLILISGAGANSAYFAGAGTSIFSSNGVSSPSDGIAAQPNSGSGGGGCVQTAASGIFPKQADGGSGICIIEY